MSATLLVFGLFGGVISLLAMLFFFLRYGYRSARQDEGAQRSFQKAKYAAACFGGSIVLLLASFLTRPDGKISDVFFVLAFLVGPISFIGIIFFALRYLYQRKKNDEKAKASLKKALCSMAGFGIGGVLLICGVAQTPHSTSSHVVTPEERAERAENEKRAQYEKQAAQRVAERQQEAYDKQAQYEEWVAWQKSEREKAEAEEKKYTPCTADQMLADYENNAVRAKGQYNGKSVKVKGKVGSITDDGFLLEELNEDAIYQGAIRCSLEGNPDLLKSLNRGQSIVVYGKITDVGGVVARGGFNGGDITGYDIGVIKVQK